MKIQYRYVKTKRIESLYDFCQENNRQDVLLRWDYEKNYDSVKEIYNLCTGFYWFKCENNKHDSQLYDLGNIIKHGSVPKCKICNSFGTWCIEHERKDLLNRWDYNKNTISPYEISISSTKKQFFLCPRGIHESELKDLNNIRKQFKSGECKKCASIGQYGIDNISKDFIEKYWSNKNIKSPFDINRHSSTKIWIKCQEKPYHPDYELTAMNFVANKRCPYCSGKKVAKEDSVGYLYPQIKDIWAEKNKSPYDFLPKSNKKIWFNCKKHGLYRRSICGATSSYFYCPKCSKESISSILQLKVSKYISSLFEDVRHEKDCTIKIKNPKTNRDLLFDNEIVCLNLLIEVNGEQHYKASSFFYGNDKDEANRQLEYRKWIDNLKKEEAIKNGYNYLEIPYWTDDKKDTWKKLIDRKINILINNNTFCSQSKTY